ncbi:MAG: winged helix-turn-helix transcriptional regulator [Clostridia bacterium]|nr:winged helix-turn-helix transcriptional regulator [Clostridia bacterium]
MENNQKEKLNYFLVHIFNHILSWEESSFKEMGVSDLSLRELHVIEAVCRLKKSGKNRMSDIANYLSITPGSLTTSVNTLVKKGYLVRENDENDRRVVLIVPTKQADEVDKIHAGFHAAMIDEVEKAISNGETDILVNTLEKLSIFFTEKSKVRGRK